MEMRKLLLFGAVAVGVAAAGAPAAAQAFPPLAVEVRGGAAFPIGDFSDDEILGASTGVGYGINATLQATSLLGIYAGYERAEFGSDDTAFGDADLTDEGFAFGGRLSLPIVGLRSLGPWLRAGAVFNRLTIDTDTNLDEESDRQLGFEFGGGISIPLGMVVTVTPGVRYRSYSPGIFSDGDPSVSYFVADLGLRFGF